MKICLWLSNSFEHQYASFHLLFDLIKELQKEDSLYVIQKQFDNGSIPDELYSNSTAFYSFPVKKREKSNLLSRYVDDINYYLRSFKIIKNHHDIDVVFLQSNNAPFLPIMFCSIKKIPVVYNVQDIFPNNAIYAGLLDKNSIKARLLLFLQKKAYSKAATIITISQDMKNTICSCYDIDDSKVKVAYNWGHSNTILNNNHFSESYPKGENEFRITYAGNIGKMQNVEIIIRAAEHIDKNTNIKFYIIGDGANKKSLETYVKEKKLSNVIFLGLQDPTAISSVYSLSDINIIPLKKDIIYTALPSKTADCLKEDTPLIFCINKESNFAQKLIENRINVVDPEDSKELADTILKMFEKKDQTNHNVLRELFLKDKSIDVYVNTLHCFEKEDRRI